MIVILTASWCAISPAHLAAASFNAPSTTSWPAWCPGPPDSLNTNTTQSGDVRQSFNGSIKGCFRVPDDRSPTLHVAWQSFVQLNASAPGPTTTNPVSNSADGHFKLTISMSRVHPGERVKVIGRYITGHRPSNSENGILCWDGCEGGLQEQGQALRWVSSTEFETTLLVPSAPWFVAHDGRASVHPLSSGTYPVGIECVTVVSGCALGPADAQVDVHLVAPKATWCSAALPCGSLQVNRVHTSVGDVVEVRGKAPLATIIAKPFGYWLAYSSTSLGSGAVSFHTHVTSETTATVAPRTLSVSTGATWALQRLSPVIASSWSSSSSLTPSSSGTEFATCSPGAIVITNGRRTIRVPTARADELMVAHHLNVKGSPGPAACVSALVDPESPSHVFASFTSARQGTIPPSYLAGLYTTNGGVAWHLVPAPAGHTSYDFGAFVQVGADVEATFVDNNYDEAGGYSSRGTITTESTSDGGATWAPSTLGCPSRGPCVVFGPSIPSNCAMSAQAEPVFYGAGESTDGTVFSQSRWITDVNACFSQELAATRSGTELLLDPSSPYPLVASRDGGRTWYNVQLPRLASLGTDASTAESLIIDGAGALLATTSNAQGATSLYLLAPGATAWCHALTIAGGRATYVSPLRTTGDDVYWGEGSSAHISLHVVPSASLDCSN